MASNNRTEYAVSAFAVVEPNHGETSTHNISFYGDTIRTTVTSDPDAASRWISEVESFYSRPDTLNITVGLDVEWRPNTNRIINPAATLQVSVGRRCLILQLIHCAYIPSAIHGFFANPRCTFVGVGIQSDLEKLQEEYAIGFNANAKDLREMAADEYYRRDLSGAGLKTLAAVVLDKVVEKPASVRRSRWDNRRLTEEQIRYASIDAFVCGEIGRSIEEESSSTSSYFPHWYN